MDDVKLCKDCKHHRPYKFEQYVDDGSSDKCARSYDDGRSLVRGEAFSYCSVKRDGNWLTARMFNKCGKEARWFEPREAV